MESFDKVTRDDLEDHVYELFIDRRPDEGHLGILCRKNGVEITVAGQDLEITQSLGLLNSSVESSTTGAVVWSVSPLFCEWVLKSGLQLKDTVVVELGSGVGGVVASVLAPKVRKFIATDQEHLLKLLRKNIVANTVKGPPAEVLEYDWEYADQLIQNMPPLEPGLVIACDTIYNDYLIPHFTTALITVLRKMGSGSRVLIAQQLRSEEIMESILTHLLDAGLDLYSVPISAEPRLAAGYSIHYLEYHGN